MPKAARRTVLLLVVAAMLALPWAASAAGPQASPRPARALLSGTLDLFSHLWSLFRKGGCGLDPSGLCATKEGCIIDPNGQPACGPTSAKGGCGIDPSGNPVCGPTSAADAGCTLDPGGIRCGGRQ